MVFSTFKTVRGFEKDDIHDVAGDEEWLYDVSEDDSSDVAEHVGEFGAGGAIGLIDVCAPGDMDDHEPFGTFRRVDVVLVSPYCARAR